LWIGLDGSPRENHNGPVGALDVLLLLAVPCSHTPVVFLGTDPEVVVSDFRKSLARDYTPERGMRKSTVV
jgi:hypothetical protein